MVDVQMCSPHLRILLGGEAFVVIGNNGKVSYKKGCFGIADSLSELLDYCVCLSVCVCVCVCVYVCVCVCVYVCLIVVGG